MWENLAAFLLDILFPPRQSERLVRTLTLVNLQTLACENEYGALPYTREEAKALVWELKYHRNPRAAALAGEFLSETLLAVAAEELGKPLLIPIPMHAARRKARGYNQTELLCEKALEHLSSELFEYAPHLLARIRDTKSQQGLPKHLRLHNVEHSMKVTDPDAVRIRGRVCVVVDDVYTTGATFVEAKRALTLAGARAVHFVGLARS